MKHQVLKQKRPMGPFSGLSHQHLEPFVHLLGIFSVACMLVWILHFRDGFALSGSAVFNIHPLLMVGGFIVVSSEAILAFRTVGGTKQFKKAVHLNLQGVAILSGLIGILAALKFHLDKGIPNFYSLHSWLGILTFLLYIFQWGLGFLTFWYPGYAPSVRRELLPWHVFLGIAIYMLALATAELGLLEKLTFLQMGGGVAQWSREAMFVNLSGLVLFIFGTLVVLTAVIPTSIKTIKEDVHRADA